ncbi:DUF4280 domain-containing protein [[Clostridium] polysaccharolyticum]|uniref:DUF4280 domain-containing protein n=1 Tax=[Clostridium] polysaccharolyticum TaxID=29364 RepID=A0A1I0CAZ0_9FIRM|nr:DUF4280 domain-containing protein [[Clostridium] polysaccharolyticum]SET16435.1 protein of unknown function [[Clostridium] polysaccharolyticum]
MGFCVCGGAMLNCSFGMAPSTLNVLPKNKVASNMPIANIMDNVPMVNVPPFGMCTSMANPQVAAATAAALGVLTPMPCVPVLTAPWAPGSPTVLIGNMPALNQSSKLMCAWAGVIQIANPGTTNIQVP